MSHTVTIDLKLKNEQALRNAAIKMNLRLEVFSSVTKLPLFDGNKIPTKYRLHLPGWRYPVLITPEGEVFYDNYGGRWGKQETLEQFLQNYSKEVTLEELQQQGFRLAQENVLEDQAVELVFVL